MRHPGGCLRARDGEPGRERWGWASDLSDLQMRIDFPIFVIQRNKKRERFSTSASRGYLSIDIRVGHTGNSSILKQFRDPWILRWRAVALYGRADYKARFILKSLLSELSKVPDAIL